MKAFLTILIYFVTITVNLLGLLLIIFSDGGMLNLSLGILTTTFFKDFQLPGIMLILTVGATSLISLYGLIQKTSKRYNYTLFAGWVLFIWCCMQIYYVNYFVLVVMLYMFLAISIILISYQLKGKNLV